VRYATQLGAHVDRLSGVVPTAYRELSTAIRGLTLAGVAVLGLLIVTVSVTSSPETDLWIRVELTFAAALAFTIGRMSVNGTAGRVRRVRSWIALGLALWLLGELIRNAELVMGIHAAPALSDLPSMGVLACAGLAFSAALRGQLRRSEELAVYLDAAIIFFATAALVVTTFADWAGVHADSAIDLAHAVFFLGISGAILVLTLALRAERRPQGTYAIVAGAAILGVGFLLHLASSRPIGDLGAAGADGASHLLALGVLGVALGAATWTDAIDEDPGYARFAARLRSAMPMVAVGLTALLVVVHLVRQLSGVVGVVNLAAIGLMLFTVAVRQSVLLTDHEASMRRERELGGELSDVEVKYRSLVERQPGVVYVAEPGPAGRWHFVSPQLETMLGFTPGEWTADPELWARSIHPDDREAVLIADEAAADPGMPRRFEYRMCTRDDDVVWVLDDSMLTEGPAGEPMLQGMLIDITAAKLAEEALRASEEQQRVIIETASLAFVAIDQAGTVTEWNRQAEETFGWPRGEAIGFELAELIVPPTQRVAHREGLRRFGEAGEGRVLSRRMELEALHRDGHTFPIELTIWAVHSADAVNFYALVDDITARKQLEAQLRHQALHDSLTGLANRTLFTDRTQHALDRASGLLDSSMAVLLLDLDDFKAINDKLGHGAGDELLVAVALRLGGSLRPADTAARLGGDEFGILLENVALEAPDSVADRLLATFDRPFTVQGAPVQLNASIGIAADVPVTSTPNELLRNAELAMYAAKQRGKGRHQLFEERMHEEAVRLIELETALERAIEKDQLEVHYQPIVELGDGLVVGFEALLRWRDSDGRYVPVAEVISVAEQTGLIAPISRFVLADACQKAIEWVDPIGAPMYVAVNVSASQLVQGAVVSDVEAALRDSGLDPAALVIEITETTLIDDSLAAVRELRQLRKLGVRLALDDFGTGYSSLGRLQHLPFDVVKIDRSFISRVTQEQEGAVVRSIIEMAATMGLEVVAEGIETPAQLSALRTLGCRLGQGYYFSRPVPPEALAAILAVGRLPLPRPRLQVVPARGA
jgi:diguanylate cyclase (GGDEF)-like protein/PAS domain S-box-containing protein